MQDVEFDPAGKTPGEEMAKTARSILPGTMDKEVWEPPGHKESGHN